MTDWLDIAQLQLSPCKPDGYIPRPSSSLTELIREHGPVHAVVVRRRADDKYDILANAETWVAAGRVGLHKVPVTIREDLTDTEAAEIVDSHYTTRARNPLDEARYFDEQLDAYGGRDRHGAVTKLAAVSGRSRSYIAHAIRLLKLPNAVQELIAQGKLSAGQARPLVSLRDPAAQERLAVNIACDGLSVRATETMVRGLREDNTPKPKARQEVVPRKSADVVRFERQVSESLGAQFTLENGRAVIDYHGDLQILQGIVARLGVHDT